MNRIIDTFKNPAYKWWMKLTDAMLLAVVVFLLVGLYKSF